MTGAAHREAGGREAVDLSLVVLSPKGEAQLVFEATPPGPPADPPPDPPGHPLGVPRTPPAGRERA